MKKSQRIWIKYHSFTKNHNFYNFQYSCLSFNIYIFLFDLEFWCELVFLKSLQFLIIRLFLIFIIHVRGYILLNLYLLAISHIMSILLRIILFLHLRNYIIILLNLPHNLLGLYLRWSLNLIFLLMFLDNHLLLHNLLFRFFLINFTIFLFPLVIKFLINCLLNWLFWWLFIFPTIKLVFLILVVNTQHLFFHGIMVIFLI